MRYPAYIAGSFAGPNDAAVLRNVARALGVGWLATERGFAPLVPHAAGWLGVHGGKDEDPGVRTAALTCGVSIARAVAAVGGHMWIVLRDDGTMSDGTALEHDCFRAHGGTDLRLIARRWDEWAAEGARELWPEQNAGARIAELLAERTTLRDEVRRLGDLVTEYRDRTGY
jgi:hypothetical protein